MTSDTRPDIVVLPDPLHRLTRTLFARAGWSDRDAGLTADHLVLSNASGHDSHGVGMAPRYLRVAAKGSIPRGPSLTTVLDAGALITLDGGMGLGQVVGFDAMNIAIARAQSLGTAIVALRNTHHLGRIGHWGEQVANAGLVAIHFVNVIGRPPLVAPWGGTQARFSTNPICIAFPRPGQPPVVVDFATSRIAHGKTRVAWKRGVEVADGNLLGRDGTPTRDPSVMWIEPFGALLPFGEHKGFGLGMMCELLAGALGGAGTIPGRTDWDVIDNNMLSILIDPARLGGADAYARETDRLVEWVYDTPTMAGVDRMRIPGEPEREMRAQRGRDGIPIDPTTWGDILEAAAELGIDEPAVRTLAALD